MSLFTIGTKAMNASYAALQTTGHNISNAGTKGYSRQQVELETAGGNFTGAGFFGRGVDVATITRSHNDFLAREAVITQSAASGDTVRAQQLTRLENLFPTGEGGIGFKSGEMLNAFADVATRPQDVSARQVVLSRVNDVAAAFRDAGEGVETLQAGVREDLRTATKQVTDLAARVADINKTLTANQGLGHTMNDLLDQRDELVRQISSLIGISTVMSEDGAMNLFIGGGQILVLGSDSGKLATAPNEFDPSRSSIALTDPNGARVLPDELLTGGAIGGLMRFQGEDLVAARSQLGQMAAALSSRVNSQQALGLDLTLGAGKPLFSVGGAQVRPSVNNAVDAGGLPLASYLDANGVRQSSVQATVVDATQLRAAEYELRAAASGVAGDYSLTEVPGGTTVTVRSGDVVNGLRIDIVGPPPGPSDRFLVQPVASAAREMRSEMSDPRGIAAAAPVTATLGTTNTGTAVPASLRPTAVDNTLPAMGARITFGATNADGSMAYTWEQLDASGATVSSAGGTWRAGSPISSASWGVSQRVQWDLRLTGVPRSGDTVSVAPTVVAGPNNGNAEALLALRDERLVGVDPSVGGGVLTGATITDAWARSIADIGLRVQTGKTAAQTSEAVASRAMTDLKSTSGVNLDEEAARLMQYQQSYQAAAKVLQVAQSVMDMLLRSTSS